MARGTIVATSVPEPVIDEEPIIGQEDDEVIDEPVDPETERRARQMGWHPLSEYRGPPDKWRSAEEFLRVGETEIPVMRRNLKVMGDRLEQSQGTIEELRAKVDEQTQVLNDLRNIAQRANQQGYDRAMAELKGKQRAAVSEGDTIAYDAIEEQITTMEAERAKAAPAATTPAPTPTPTPRATPARTPPPPAVPEIEDFAERNSSWWNVDAAMTNYATSCDSLLKNDPDWRDQPLADRLSEVERLVRQKFSDRFGGSPQDPGPRRPRAAAVAQPRSTTPGNRQRAPATGIDSIPDAAERAEARDQFNRMKRQFPDYTEAEYMAVYDNPRTDIIAMQHQLRSRANGKGN